MNSSPPLLKQARDGCNTQEKLKTILKQSFFIGGGGVQAQYHGQYESDYRNLIDSLYLKSF